MSHRGANAISASITTTDDDNVLVFGADVGVVGETAVQEGFGVGCEEFHCKVDTREVPVCFGGGGVGGGGCGEDDVGFQHKL